MQLCIGNDREILNWKITYLIKLFVYEELYLTSKERDYASYNFMRGLRKRQQLVKI
jgi:hypothetical protein